MSRGKETGAILITKLLRQARYMPQLFRSLNKTHIEREYY
jgi:hypothetical protein